VTATDMAKQATLGGCACEPMILVLQTKEDF
jgi:hypothetical protein